MKLTAHPVRTGQARRGLRSTVRPWIGYLLVSVGDSIHTRGFPCQPQTPVIASIKANRIITPALSHLLIPNKSPLFT
jgi:hypothetical protein